MKLFSMLAFIFALTPVAHADLKTDHDSIAAMKGCFEVTFHFEETGTTDPNYPIRSKEYNEHGLEWVELDRDTGTLLSLQHILLTPGGALKHWRQQWEYQPESALYFKGNATWRTEMLNSTTVAGKWIQRVFQVDDSPRYECVAEWTGNSWECATYAPLPRREFTQRSDYNVLDRTNQHVINADGWLHVQNNRKLIVNEKGVTQVATEKGLDTYRRVEDSRCLDAKKHWAENKLAWNTIQDMWMHMRDHHPAFSLTSRVNNQLLWEALFELEDAAMKEASTLGALDVKALQKKAHDLIHLYMVVLE
jgi:hypothetical protein